MHPLMHPSDSSLLSLTELFQLSLTYYHTHGQGAYPYEQYIELFELVQKYRPKRIFEAGTGHGLTAIAMALASAESQIITVDKNPEILQLARIQAQKYKVDNQISFLNQLFLDTTKTQANSSYDLVFFDGFAPGFIIFLELERILKRGGILVIANLKLRGDRRKISLKMSDPQFYELLHQAEDTLVSLKTY